VKHNLDGSFEEILLVSSVPSLELSMLSSGAGDQQSISFRASKNERPLSAGWIRPYQHFSWSFPDLSFFFFSIGELLL